MATMDTVSFPLLWIDVDRWKKLAGCDPSICLRLPSDISKGHFEGKDTLKVLLTKYPTSFWSTILSFSPDFPWWNPQLGQVFLSDPWMTWGPPWQPGSFRPRPRRRHHVSHRREATSKLWWAKHFFKNAVIYSLRTYHQSLFLGSWKSSLQFSKMSVSSVCLESLNLHLSDILVY